MQHQQSHLEKKNEDFNIIRIYRPNFLKKKSMKLKVSNRKINLKTRKLIER